MIEVDRLRKTFGELVAVDDISFKTEPGQIFGLLGPNGVGKSTTIGCISGLLKPSEGRVTVRGYDVAVEPEAAKEKLGIVPQEIALYKELSAIENLNFWGSAYGLRGSQLRKRVNEALELTGLLDRAKEPCKRFSGGMQRRLNFAAGLVHSPEVLLLDEPTVGVDPQSRVRLLELVREQANSGITVLYTTHYMEEAESLCDYLAIIDHGQIIASGTLPELRGLLGEHDVLRLTGSFDPAPVGEVLTRLDNTEIVSIDRQSLMLTLKDGSKKLPMLFELLNKAGAEIRDTTLTQPNLESLFIKLTGKELRE
ncbi:MAG: ABC transporter ATP-binding protein [bacterium]